MISRALALALLFFVPNRPTGVLASRVSSLTPFAHASSLYFGVSALDRYLNRIDCTGLHMRGRAAGRCLHAQRAHATSRPHTTRSAYSESTALIPSHKSHSIIHSTVSQPRTVSASARTAISSDLISNWLHARPSCLRDMAPAALPPRPDVASAGLVRAPRVAPPPAPAGQSASPLCAPHSLCRILCA